MPTTKSTGGFSLVEVMIATVFLTVGLMAVVASATTTSMLRKRAIEEDRVFAGMISRMEWVRGELFSDSDFHAAVAQATATGGTLNAQFSIDQNGDGIQDVKAAAGDNETPVLSVSVAPAAPYNNPELLLEVQITASWWGSSGNRSLNIESLIANRSGYSG